MLPHSLTCACCFLFEKKSPFFCLIKRTLGCDLAGIVLVILSHYCAPPTHLQIKRWQHTYDPNIERQKVKRVQLCP